MTLAIGLVAPSEAALAAGAVTGLIYHPEGDAIAIKNGARLGDFTRGVIVSRL